METEGAAAAAAAAAAAEKDGMELLDVDHVRVLEYSFQRHFPDSKLRHQGFTFSQWSVGD